MVASTPVSDDDARIDLTGYPQGLPSWEVPGGAATLENIRFWVEYDEILKGFIDFYRTFFSQVSTRNAPMLDDLYFPEQVESVLLFNNDFLGAAKKVIYRNDAGKLIVTISQNSIGNAITELLGVVVKRVPDADAYEKKEPQLIEKLLEVRRRLIDADLGDGIETPYWSAK